MTIQDVNIFLIKLLYAIVVIEQWAKYFKLLSLPLPLLPTAAAFDDAAAADDEAAATFIFKNLKKKLPAKSLRFKTVGVEQKQNMQTAGSPLQNRKSVPKLVEKTFQLKRWETMGCVTAETLEPKNLESLHKLHAARPPHMLWNKKKPVLTPLASFHIHMYE